MIGHKAISSIGQPISGLAWWLFPPRCLVCGGEGQPGRDLCRPCEAELPRRRDPNAPLGATPQGATTPWVVPFHYRPPLDHLIRDLKFRHRLPVARLLGELLATAVEARGLDLPVAVVPVPLHRERLRQRGFNQATEIALAAAGPLGLPVRTDALLRTGKAPPQSRLTARARRANVDQAFVLRRPLPPRVALVDDVCTTGATLEAALAPLTRAGVQQIQLWVVATTPHDDRGENAEA
ncbi:MAG: ComF family protein [Candidatus Competibacterales bacterium]